jgi:hypothetical protein
MYGRRDSRNNKTLTVQLIGLIVAMAKISLSVTTGYSFRGQKNKIIKDQSRVEGRAKLGGWRATLQH